MKKYYFFAALATVGLFASCSSDEDFSDASEARQAAVIDDEAPALVNIAVTNPYETRGTGLVGGTTTAGNTWDGQTFNMFMFEKGTFTVATNADGDIFNNKVMTTELGSSAANYVVGGVKQFYEYPDNTKSYSFWAYRIDDAYTNGEGKARWEDGVTTEVADMVVNGVNDADATEITIPFKINGSQDILIGEAKEEAAETKLAAKATSLTPEEVKAKIYSAYAARRDVNPTIKFTHALTRLYFEVWADSRDVSDQAELKTIDVNEKKGFEITDIIVKSKSTGNIIAAYKSTSPKADEYATAANRVVFTPDDQELAEFKLMSRKQNLESTLTKAAQCAFVEKAYGNTSVTVLATADFAAVAGIDGHGAVAAATAADVDNPGVKTVDANTLVYTSDDIADDGTPATAPVKYGQLPGGTEKYYYVYYREGYTAPVYDDEYVDQPTEKLIPLAHVTPGWKGYVPAIASGAKVFYQLTKISTVADGCPEYADEPASGALNSWYKNTTDGKYYQLTAINDATNPWTYTWTQTVPAATYTWTQVPETPAIAAAATAFTPDAAPTASTDGGGAAVGDYRYYTAGTDVPAAEGEAIATPVGHCMFVAPADQYEVTVKYDYTRPLNGNEVTPDHGQATVTVKAKKVSDASATAFRPGKSYKIAVKLFKNGTIDTSTEADSAELEAPEDDDEVTTDQTIYDAE